MYRLRSICVWLVLLLVSRWSAAQAPAGEFTGFVRGPNKTYLAGARVSASSAENG